MGEVKQLGEQMLGIALAEKPCVARACVGLASPSEVFEWLKDAAEIYKEQRSRYSRKIINSIVGRADSESDSSVPWVRRPVFFGYVGNYVAKYPCLPLRTDASLSAYCDRLRDGLTAEEFGFQLPNLEAANEEAFLRFREIALPFSEMLGPRVMRFNAFFGDYRRTPFGIHADLHHDHAFQYIVEGVKTLRVWDSRLLYDRIGEAELLKLFNDPLSYDGELPGAQTYTAEPGDILYWPATFTHCLESTGPSCGIGFIVESRRRTLDDNLKVRLSESIERIRRETGISAQSDWVDDVEGLRRFLRKIARELESERSERELVLDGLAFKSGLGSFGTIPARRSVAVEASSTIDSLVPIGATIECVGYGQALCVACNGHSMVWSVPEESVAARELIASLKTAKDLLVATVVKRSLPSVGEAAVLKLIEFLASTYAIRLTNNRIGLGS